jgi:AbrB family looped-hinge helix DNA binding protein
MCLHKQTAPDAGHVDLCEKADWSDRYKAVLYRHLVSSIIADVSIAEFRVSDRGQMALPAEARRRWNIAEGGSVEVADLGDALLIVPAGRGGLRSMLRDAINEAGGYSRLAAQVAAEDPDLA